jgi:hypothetical protein
MAACLLAWTALCLAFGAPPTALRAQPPAAARELLNSERIEQKFGSYGIAVLRSDARHRVANLYSATRPAAGEPERRTCRTFAVTRYPDEVAAAFAAEHREILAGGSIGAVLAAHGWRVTKSHLYYGERPAGAGVAELMHVTPGTRLAVDAYVLEIAKGEARFTYASIVEILHPDHLALPELAAIYGPADARGRERLLESLLADADTAAR